MRLLEEHFGTIIMSVPESKKEFSTRCPLVFVHFDPTRPFISPNSSGLKSMLLCTEKKQPVHDHNVAIQNNLTVFFPYLNTKKFGLIYFNFI